MKAFSVCDTPRRLDTAVVTQELQPHLELLSCSCCCSEISCRRVCFQSSFAIGSSNFRRRNKPGTRRRTLAVAGAPRILHHTTIGTASLRKHLAFLSEFPHRTQLCCTFPQPMSDGPDASSSSSSCLSVPQRGSSNSGSSIESEEEEEESSSSSSSSSLLVQPSRQRHTCRTPGAPFAGVGERHGVG